MILYDSYLMPILLVIYALVQVCKELFLGHVVDADISKAVLAGLEEALLVHCAGDGDHRIDNRGLNAVGDSQVMIHLAADRDKALADKKEDAEPNPYALTRGSDYYRR